MANEFIEILSPSALKDLATANTEVLTLIKNIDNAGKAMSNVKTPSGSDGAVKNLNANLLRTEKLYTDVQIKTEKLAQAQAQSVIKTNQLEASTIRLNKAKELSVKQLERENAKLEASLSLQSKTSSQLKKVQFAYDELAIKKQRYNNLSANEEKRLVTLTNTLQKYRTIQDGVNTTVGKFQQRVGNYATAFNPLSNSINQLSREMPAFANSVQTGFMAISNNLPIFFDAMENAIAQQKELQKQGLPSKNALQLLAGSFFTLGTALSLGVTALTIFAPMLIKAITNSEQKTKAIEAEKKAREAQLQVEKQHFDQQSKYASDEQARAKIALENAKNLSLPLQERLKNVDELRQRYPEYLGLLSKEQILAGDTADAEYRLNDALMKRALFLAVQDKIKETTKELVDAEFKYLTIAQKSNDVNNIYDKSIQNTTKSKQKYRLVTQQEANSTEYLKKVEEDRTKSLSKGNVAQLSATDVLRQNTISARDKLTILYKILNENAKYNNVVVDETKKLKENTTAKKENNKEDEKVNSSSLNALQNTISKLKESYQNATIGSTQYGLLANQIKLLEEVYNGLTNSIDNATEAQEDFILLSDEEVFYDVENKAELTRKAIIALELATENWLKTLQSDAFNKAFDNIGLSSAKMFFDFDENGMSTFDKLMKGADTLGEKFAVTFQAVGDVAQDVFNKITELQNARFQNEFDNLSREKEIALAFAGENVAGREEIERQYDERKRAIEKRQAESRKKLAIFNAIVDTAQGVVSAIARVDLYPYNFVLAGIIGALGAAQIAMISSTPMPAYEKGTMDAKEGLAWTQEKGAEIITDKNGKIKTLGSNKGAQLTKMERGDKVYTASQSALMFNDQLNGILLNNGISSPKVEVVNNSALTDGQVSSIVSAIQNKETTSLNIDKGGLNVFVRNGHSTKEIMNNRVRGIGKSV